MDPLTEYEWKLLINDALCDLYASDHLIAAWWNAKTLAGASAYDWFRAGYYQEVYEFALEQMLIA
jgi:hypothetical protein